ncbi:MAG TPA: hypothetical protein VH210_07655 [Gaiellaceae bacterium]|jgi:hypothetical protein|nr:hypothetical protein [Gaiellaceae bacterium]
MVFAAEIEGRLRVELERLAKNRRPIAEINREIGARAEALGLTRPSYARVRQIVLEVRDRVEVPSWGELLLDVDLRLRSPMVLLDKLGGTRPMDEDAGLKGGRGINR